MTTKKKNITTFDEHLTKRHGKREPQYGRPRARRRALFFDALDLGRAGIRLLREELRIRDRLDLLVDLRQLFVPIALGHVLSRVSA